MSRKLLRLNKVFLDARNCTNLCRRGQIHRVHDKYGEKHLNMATAKGHLAVNVCTVVKGNRFKTLWCLLEFSLNEKQPQITPHSYE